MSRYCWTAEELLDHAHFLEEKLAEIDLKRAAVVAERYAKRVEAKEPVLADWVRRSVTHARWLQVIDRIRADLAIGDFKSATWAAQSFENERNHIAGLLDALERRAGALAVAGAEKGRSARQDKNAHRDEQIRAYFAKHEITPNAVKRFGFGLSDRHVRRIVTGK